MARRTVSIIQAASNALGAWLALRLPDLGPRGVSTEWRDAGIPIPETGAVTLIRAGGADEDPVRPPECIAQTTPANNRALFTFRTHVVAQPLQLDVWATSRTRRDDLLQQLGDALTVGKAESLAGYLAANALPTNFDPVEQSLTLQLAAPWEILLAAYQFEAPETSDTADSTKRLEYRATYAGTAYFDRVVVRELPTVAKVSVPVTVSPQALPETPPSSPPPYTQTLSISVTSNAPMRCAPANAVIDQVAGGASIEILPGQASWNISEPPSGTNTYNLVAETTASGHRIEWGSGLAPVVVAPAGWQLRDPLNGALVASYTYEGGIGESYAWSAAVAELVFEPKG